MFQTFAGEMSTSEAFFRRDQRGEGCGLPGRRRRGLAADKHAGKNAVEPLFCFCEAGREIGVSERFGDTRTSERRSHGINSPTSGSENRRPNGRSIRSEEHTSELQSLMRNSYAVFCLKTKIKQLT